EGVAVGNQRVANDRVSPLKPVDRLSHFFDPSSIFMPHNVRQFHIDFLPPDAFDHMEIGAADTGATNSDHHVRLTLDLRFRYFFQSDKLRIGESSIILMEYRSFHRLNHENGDYALPLSRNNGVKMQSYF